MNSVMSGVLQRESGSEYLTAYLFCPVPSSLLKAFHLRKEYR